MNKALRYLLICMMAVQTFLPSLTFALDNGTWWAQTPLGALTSSATVNTAEDFFAALADPAITEINLSANITLATKVFITKDSLIINGNGHTITLPTKTWWWGTTDQRGELLGGDYIFQVFESSNVSIKNLTFEWGDAAMLVTNSTVTVSAIKILNPDVGGIEVKWSSVVTVAGPITEIGNPGAILWVDGPTNDGMIVWAANYDLVQQIVNNQFVYISLADYLANNQEYTLASGGVCALNTDKDEVSPALTPWTGDYGYYMTITDKKTNIDSNYIYYAGATNTPIDSCADTATVSILWTSLTITNWATFELKPSIPIVGEVNLWTFTANKVWSAPSCKYVLTSALMDKWWRASTNKNACKLIWKWEDKPSNKGICTIDVPLDLLSQANYSPKLFNINTLTLPEITPENASGYAVEFFPLALDNTAVTAIELLNLAENSWVSVNPAIRTALDNPLYTALGASAGVCGIGIDLPTVTVGGGSCNLANLSTILGNVTAALGNSALWDLGSTLGSLGSLGANLGGLLGGLQWGTVDPDALSDLQTSLAWLQLPNFTATAASLTALADALEQANSCLSLLGTNATATIAALRNTAASLTTLDTSIAGIQSAINTLQSSNLSASQYLDALATLTSSLATTFTSLANLQDSFDALADSMNSLSIPWVGNLWAIAPVFWVIADLLDGIVDTTSGLVGGLQQASTTLSQLADLVQAIESNNTNAIITALDVLAHTNAFTQAQQTTIATLAAAQDIINTVRAIYAVPAPVLNTNNLSCNSVESHQTDMIAYLDAQITLYTQLQTNVTALDAVVNIGATDINTQITQIINQLNTIKNQVSSVNVQATCADGAAALADLKSQFDTIKTKVEQAIADAHTMLNNLKDEITAHVSSIQATLATINTAVNGIINMIPGLSSAVKAQIKTALQDLQTRLIAGLGNFVQSSQSYLIKQKLDAPSFTDLVCQANKQQITTGNSVTFAMNTHAKANEAWGYIATVTTPDLTTSVYVLPGGTASDLVINTPATGDYTMTVRTIGKDAFVHTQPVFDFLATLNLNDTQFAQIGDFSRLQAALNSLNASVGTWTKLTNADVLSTLNGIDALVAQYASDSSWKGQAVQALFNPTAVYTALVTSNPTAADVYVYAITNEEISTTLSGSDLNTTDLSYTLSGVASPASFDATYTQSQTIPYTVSKTVWTCETPLTAQATVHVIVIDRPTTMNITHTGEVATVFNGVLTGTNLAGIITYSGTFSSIITAVNGVYSGTFSWVAGTSTGSYQLCLWLVISGYLEPVCSNVSMITLVATAKPANTGGNSGGWDNGGPTTTPPTTTTSSNWWPRSSGWPVWPVNPTTPREIILSGEVDELVGTNNCSIESSLYPQEENQAYLYACENDITTLRTVQSARMYDYVTRGELAKMLSQYAVQQLGLTPDTDKDCSAFADSITSQSKEIRNYMIMSCQLNIMGINPDTTALNDFRPNDTVTRAEFGTVMSRILWGSKYEVKDGSEWYAGHLQALKNTKIIKDTSPATLELRAWIMLILHRSTTK